MCYRYFINFITDSDAVGNSKRKSSFFCRDNLYFELYFLILCDQYGTDDTQEAFYPQLQEYFPIGNRFFSEDELFFRQ